MGGGEEEEEEEGGGGGGGGGGRRTGAMAELSKLGDLGRSGEGEREDGSTACETCACVCVSVCALFLVGHSMICRKLHLKLRMVPSSHTPTDGKLIRACRMSSRRLMGRAQPAHTSSQTVKNTSCQRAKTEKLAPGFMIGDTNGAKLLLNFNHPEKNEVWILRLLKSRSCCSLKSLLKHDPSS